jgi:predicted neutral ceramidase superfamily lipid hydrolase
LSHWAKFIAWVDADIVKTSPGLKGVASMMFAAPLLIALPFLTAFQPHGADRYWIVGLSGMASGALFIIWLWRVIVNIRG